MNNFWVGLAMMLTVPMSAQASFTIRRDLPTTSTGVSAGMVTGAWTSTHDAWYPKVYGGGGEFDTVYYDSTGDQVKWLQWKNGVKNVSDSIGSTTRRPDIDGNTIVYEVVNAGGIAILWDVMCR